MFSSMLNLSTLVEAKKMEGGKPVEVSPFLSAYHKQKQPTCNSSSSCKCMCLAAGESGRDPGTVRTGARILFLLTSYQQNMNHFS